MSQITARLPQEMAQVIDLATQGLHHSQAAIVRKYIKMYLGDFDNLNTTCTTIPFLEPDARLFDWAQAKRLLQGT